MPRTAVACCLLALAATACGPAEPENALKVTPLQYRDDIPANRLQLQVTNGLAEELRLAAVQLRWSGFDSELTAKDAVVAVGQRVDLPVVPLPARCVVQGTSIGDPPALDEAAVIFTLTDGTTRMAEVVDSDGSLEQLYASDCERVMIGRQIGLEFVAIESLQTATQPITTGILRLTRREAVGAVAVVSSSNTIVFTLGFLGVATDSPILVLPANAATAEVPVQFLPGRCDAHAVAEAKQPFRFVLQVQLGDEPGRSYVVEPASEVQLDMLATVAAGCAALGADGSLGGSG